MIGNYFKGCRDIDECKVGDEICPTGRTCTNHYGTFDCPCNHGLIESKNSTCDDINECIKSSTSIVN